MIFFSTYILRFPFIVDLSLFFFIRIVVTFLFIFLRDTDSRKGTMCPLCVPIHKKKRKKKSLCCF